MTCPRRRAWRPVPVRAKRRIEAVDGLVTAWEPGQSAALDGAEVASGADVGSVVERCRTDQRLEDVRYGVDFAFAFHAFHPKLRITIE